MAVCAFDYYRVPPEAAERMSFRYVEHARDYLPAIEQALSEVAARGLHFDLCLYNAGMDPYEGCDTGGLSGVTREMKA